MEYKEIVGRFDPTTIGLDKDFSLLKYSELKG
jgi:hypothetical protein